MQLKTKLVFLRETPGAVLFGEIDVRGMPIQVRDGLTGNVYLRKSKLNGKIPPRIEITIDIPEAK